MQKAGIEKPEITDQSAADLFAYFVAARFFEPPGDAARGKHDFNSPALTEDEVRQILGYVRARQYFGSEGNPAKRDEGHYREAVRRLPR